MKRNRSILSYITMAASLMVTFSCKKELAVKNPATMVVAVSPKDTNFVSLSVAIGAAQQANNSHLVSAIIAKKAVQSVSALSSKQILDTLAVPDNANPSYYIFNYVGGGYVIIPADKRVEPILSYSNNGYFPKSGTLPSGLVDWLMVNYENMQLLRKNTALKAPAGIAKLWAELAVTNSANTGNKVLDKTAPPPPPSCEPTTTVQTVGPLLQTAWGQGYPYNLLCPPASDPYTSYAPGYGIDPTGCVATAMAQLMYYWKAPARYNWSIMPLTSTTTGSNASNMAVAQLMVDAGRSVDMAYTDSTSGADASLVSAALKNSFGYSSASYGAYNINTVESNLNANEPVLLSGFLSVSYSWFLGLWVDHIYYTDGHEWVCDGYETVNYTWCPSDGNPGGGEGYIFLDMNWGWNEAPPYNGPNVDNWYYYNQWEVWNGQDLQNYQYDQNMTYNIHP